ncbi:hypothetical protein HanOQP8_Chr16g0612051 [Helianthus annuus]|nr:hypothetical protein HanOQP8_Chr16g0612051 [Helianthus annuus]
MGEGGRCELLGNESSQLVVSPSSGLEILPCVLCALYAPSRGPPAGLPSLIASPSVGPMVRWTKSLIAAKVAGNLVHDLSNENLTHDKIQK